MTALALLAWLALPAFGQIATTWPEQERAFLEDGPGWLLSKAEREELLALDETERAAWIERFLAKDPVPETEPNELAEGVRKRLALAYSEYDSPRDVRFQLLFLAGRPLERKVIDCGMAYKPLEVWTYAPDREAAARSIEILKAATPSGSTDYGKRAPRKFQGWDQGPKLVLYKPNPEASFRLWDPFDTKSVLYSSEMEYLLQQYDELRNFISGERFDKQVCKETTLVDYASGVSGLRDFYRGRPTSAAIRAFLAPPEDLALWARQASETRLPAATTPQLALEPAEVIFPSRAGSLLATRFHLALPASDQLKPTPEGKLKILVEGRLETDKDVFSAPLRVRFELDPPAAGGTLRLALDAQVRPGLDLVARFKVIDETSKGVGRVVLAFHVPAEPPPRDAQLGYESAVTLGKNLAEEVAAAAPDALMLAPPLDGQVALGTWRAQALVTGAKVKKVIFYVDGKPQVTRGEPPWTADLRLASYPTEQIVKAEGVDEGGKVVAKDEVILNQPRGAFRVRIREPAAGLKLSGRVSARAEVVVPEERTVAKVEFRVDDQVVATLDKPPWLAEIEVPKSGDTHYLSVVAFLDDERRTEDVRFLNAPENLDELEVRLVELYTTVLDGSGQLVRGLPQTAFQVLEDGRPQQISKFELVENLALIVGITVDTSGSMAESLAEAQKAARSFLSQVISPKDRCFVVAFSGKPSLLTPPTDDVGACLNGLDGLQAIGWTSLHDALVTSLYYMRELEGQRALILLSDGDDTSSSISYDEALEFARRSGVTIFPIGLKIGGTEFGIHRKLARLADETGGKAYFIDKAEELASVYKLIESELRSRYLIAYPSDNPAGKNFRTVEVKVKERGLKARTIRGYYP